MAPVEVDVNHIVLADPAAFRRAEQWAAEMGFAAVWVSASASREGDPREADLALQEAFRRSDTIKPIPVFAPSRTVGDVHVRVSNFAAATSCRVIRLCPSGHRYPLAPWVLSPLPEICDKESIALMIDFANERIRWEETVLFARAYPSVPIVVCGVAPAREFAACAALDAAANLVLALIASDSPETLGELVDRFGAARFVLGFAGEHASAKRRHEMTALLAEEASDSILGANAFALASGEWSAQRL